MILYFSICLFNSLANEDFTNYKDSKQEVTDFYNQIFINKLKLTGWKENLDQRNDFKSPNEVFTEIREICSKLQSVFTREFIVRISLNPSMISLWGGIMFVFRFFITNCKSYSKI